ncbi:MAG: hypothetical protein ABFS56_09710 [Pseudomonadota bacterium]
MSVISRSTKLLFCEGKPDSLDYAILARLVGNPNIIIPAGGKYGLGAFIQGRLSSYQSKKPSYLAFRDRDFDAEPPSKIELIIPFSTKPVFFSHRACIESYLLDASLIHAYWIEMAQGPKWKHGESPGIGKISAWIKGSAENIKDYQTVRWALAHLKPGERWPQVETSWTKGSGHLPHSLNLDDCKKEAKKLIKSFTDFVKGVNEDEFEKHLNAYQKKFQETEFWEQKQYMVWFHGKDLKKAMQKKWPDSISLKTFCSWATERLEFDNHHDLLELQEQIKKHDENS